MSAKLETLVARARDRPITAAGDAIVAIVPDVARPFEEATSLAAHVGGAELNFAVGARRLGRDATWIGLIGDDPAGRLVLRTLRDEDVGGSYVTVRKGTRTAIYLREWLPDGRRRPTYYRDGTAGGELSPECWPRELRPPPGWLHVTGITPALGDGAAAFVETALDWARASGAVVSFDPNFRPALWTSAGAARRRLLDLVGRSDVVLLSDEDARLLFDSEDPERVLGAAFDAGATVAVLKRGGDGAVGAVDRGPLVTAVAAATDPIDPVGAGDGFDAGFVTGLLATGDLERALRLGAWVGARAVEVLGEHLYPTADDLPARLLGDA